MSKAPTEKTLSEAHDDAPLRRADDTAGKRVLRTRGHGAVVFLNKQRVNIFLDGAVIEHVSRRPVIAAVRPSSTRRLSGPIIPKTWRASFARHFARNCGAREFVRMLAR